MSTTTLHISGLGATAATAHIEKALEALPRVSSVRVESGEGKALVEHEGADVQQMVNALKAVGYDEVRPAD